MRYPLECNENLQQKRLKTIVQSIRNPQNICLKKPDRQAEKDDYYPGLAGGTPKWELHNRAGIKSSHQQRTWIWRTEVYLSKMFLDISQAFNRVRSQGLFHKIGKWLLGKQTYKVSQEEALKLSVPSRLCQQATHRQLSLSHSWIE